MDKNDFDGAEGGYLVVTWAAGTGWTFRPVIGGPLLTSAELAELGLTIPDAPLIPPVPNAAPLLFSQGDVRWKTERLGSSTQTIGGWGCAMVTACMVYSQYDQTITPLEFNSVLTRNGGYNYLNGEAHLAWDRLPAIFPALQWKGRQDWNRRLTEVELQVIKDKLKVAPLPLWVDFKPVTAAMDTHFVLAVAYADNDIKIYDPWGGDEAWLLQRYAASGQDLRRAIWGYRELTLSGGA